MDEERGGTFLGLIGEARGFSALLAGVVPPIDGLGVRLDVFAVEVVLLAFETLVDEGFGVVEARSAKVIGDLVRIGLTPASVSDVFRFEERVGVATGGPADLAVFGVGVVTVELGDEDSRCLSFRDGGEDDPSEPEALAAPSEDPRVGRSPLYDGSIPSLRARGSAGVPVLVVVVIRAPRSGS